ncbi:complement receptor type 1-like isoform X3 [Mobula hypostoma]|uniref:complement receptor type 1-like isoform X3 n=1 Tax=Mobula hypostoma TaxID=723540 RepID=UPI002FC362D3
MTAGQLLVLLAAVVAQVAGECGKPPTLENGTPRDQVNATSPVGTRVFYTCLPGYMFQDFSIRWIICQDNSMWSPLQATCNPRSCGSPGEILNGGYNATTGNTFGSTVHFYCDKGFKLVGRDTRQCDVDGWTGQVPTCEVVKCPDPPTIANGTVSELDNREFWEYGVVASYSCVPGLILVGAAKITCEANGKWSPSPPTCRAASINITSTPATGSNNTTAMQNTTTATTGGSVGTSVAASINITSTPATGSNNTTAMQNTTTATTGGSVGTSVGNCGPPPNLENGSVSDEYSHEVSFAPNTEITYRCHPGYQFQEGSSRTLLCRADSSWSPLQTRCLPIKCPDLPSIDNGLTPSPPQGGFWEYGMVAKFSCINDFSLIGSSSLICGTTGQWNKNIPTCKVVRCFRPETPENGQVYVGFSVVHKFGDAVVYKCNPGFVMIGDSTIYCMENNNFEPPPPICRNASEITPTTAITTTSAGSQVGRNIGQQYGLLIILVYVNTQ